MAALFKSSARNPDMRKNIQVLGALVGDNAADTPGTDYQHPFHVVLLRNETLKLKKNLPQLLV
jgi:hypothetical protein